MEEDFHGNFQVNVTKLSLTIKTDADYTRKDVDPHGWLKGEWVKVTRERDSSSEKYPIHNNIIVQSHE